MVQNTKLKYTINPTKEIRFDSPKRIEWIQKIHKCQTTICRAQKVNETIETIPITLGEDITISKFDPFHIVLLSCLIELIKQKEYLILLKVRNKELQRFIHEDISLTKYWQDSKAYHLDSPDPSRLNLWRTVKGRDDEYRISVGRYFSNKYPGTDFFMLNNCLSELYFNIFDHAEANGVSFSYIHCDNQDVIHIAICDFGKGIASTMRRAFPEIKDDATALKKALEKGVSAKTQTHNKGFGLDTVISCLEEGARLRIISNSAFLMSLKTGGEVETITRRFPFSFEGSLIYFDLPISSFGETEVSDEFTFWEMEEIILNNILCGKTYPDAGGYFYGIIKDAILKSERIYVNMEGVTGLPTMFMNTSFGKIMSEFGVERLKKSMVFKNISKVQIERIGKYFKDYAEVYNPPA